MLILNCNSSIPLQTAQSIFLNSQKFDDSLVVKQFCSEAMSILTHLIHPKFPIHFNNQQTNDFVPNQINDFVPNQINDLESENDKTNKINENENESKNEDFSEISQNEKASKRIIQHEEQEAKNEIKENESSAVKKRKENELNELDKMLNDFNAD